MCFTVTEIHGKIRKYCRAEMMSYNILKYGIRGIERDSFASTDNRTTIKP